MATKKKINEIKEWLLEGKPLTGLMAVQIWGLLDLPAVISGLRREGYQIDTEMMRTEQGRFARYVISAENTKK